MLHLARPLVDRVSALHLGAELVALGGEGGEFALKGTGTIAIRYERFSEAIGIELKDSYFKQAKINMTHAESRFSVAKEKQDQLFGA